ncbi:MAG: bifunctional phosphoribosylaminoimidazolecarboxamide formyltransferase/IMP cyclohydrolase [Leptospirillum sp.]|jgi:phosphoribosylaminoimidazolecarboxamide formyltransferase/IMP cyclohydrolase
MQTKSWNNKRALISVSDKTGIVPFAKGLKNLGMEILSTGGTAKHLRENGIEVTDVSSVTNFPEMMDGRVKTLHPAIHGGLLGLRNNPEHMSAMEKHQIRPIDMVVVNLYPFAKTVLKPGVTPEEAIEQIDIGGPSMIRSASKNHESVLVLTDPSDYEMILDLLLKEPEIGMDVRRNLARKAFATTGEYDRRIALYFEGLLSGGVSQSSESELQETISLSLTKIQSLRYGENPHQAAALYAPAGERTGFANASKLHGKELSYNNFLDAQAAWSLVSEFSEPSVVIVKHNNPCGVSLGETLVSAYIQARDTDPVSSFGGVVATNRPVDLETAQEMSKIFLEVVIAPGFTKEALDILMKKKDIRLLVLKMESASKRGLDLRNIDGAFLVQTPDTLVAPPLADLNFEGDIKPTQSQVADALFAFAVGKHVKSNAIILVKDRMTIGIGAGQMSRVDSVRLSGMKATRSTQGTILASDAFFPFRDGIDEAAKLGVSGIIQPGGSIRDAEVFQAVKDHSMFMILTGMRHFRH